MADDWHAPRLAQQSLTPVTSEVPHVSVVFRKSKQPKNTMSTHEDMSGEIDSNLP